MFYSASVNSACFYESRPQFGLSARSDNNTISLWSTSNDLNQWVKPHPVRLFCRGRLQWFLTFPEWPGKELWSKLWLSSEENIGRLTHIKIDFQMATTPIIWCFTICCKYQNVFLERIGNCKQTAVIITNCCAARITDLQVKRIGSNIISFRNAWL